MDFTKVRIDPGLQNEKNVKKSNFFQFIWIYRKRFRSFVLKFNVTKFRTDEKYDTYRTYFDEYCRSDGGE